MPAKFSPSHSGRVAFMALLDTIRQEIAGGDYLTVVYARHSAALKISYSSFRKLVARYAPDVKLARRPYGSAGRSIPILPARPALSSPPPLTIGIAPHARHEHAKPRTFEHDPSPREDDDFLITGKRPDTKV